MSNQEVKRFNAVELEMMSKKALREGLNKTIRDLRSLTLTEQDLLGVVDNVSVDAAQQTFMQPESPLTRVIEGKKKSQMRPILTGEWGPVGVLKEGSNGTDKMLWKVRHQQKGTILETTFRYEVVALTAAAILNETNNMSDPRLIRLNELSKKEQSLMMELKQTKRLIEGTTDSKKRTILKNKFDDMKLTLKGVRSTLGVS